MNASDKEAQAEPQVGGRRAPFDWDAIEAICRRHDGIGQLNALAILAPGADSFEPVRTGGYSALAAAPTAPVVSRAPKLMAAAGLSRLPDRRFQCEMCGAKQPSWGGSMWHEQTCPDADAPEGGPKP
ncbi:MAG: hypothetical protein V4739_04110 [Pseudomonadota bacterium]